MDILRQGIRLIHRGLVTGLLAAILGAAPAAAQGPYTRLQVLLPGESAAPGTPSGRTGTPDAQTAGFSFSVTVRACDSQWNTVTLVNHTVEILSSDQSATLPPPAQLTSGQGTFTVTLNAGGSFTMFAHDVSDPTIPDAASPLVRVFVMRGFAFTQIERHQEVGRPIHLTLTARDPNGNLVSGFSGTVALREITSFGDGRISPDEVTLNDGRWEGSVTVFRADETAPSRGNANIYASLESTPSINGTSDPFIAHPGPFRRVQLIVPGETPLPGSLSGRIGTPAPQAAGQGFAVSVYSTDQYWNRVSSDDRVRITSSDGASNTPISDRLSGGFRQFTIILRWFGAQTLTVTDVSNSSITGETTTIDVIPSNIDHFDIETFITPAVAGEPVFIRIRATDSDENTVPTYNAEALLVANTGSGSLSPELITFQDGLWSGDVIFRGAGGAVRFTVSDFASPPHTSTSMSFPVLPGAFTKLQVLLPGETARGGTADGQDGIPSNEAAGSSFTTTVRAVDAFWNLVPEIGDRVGLASTDAFAGMPAETTLVNGQVLVPTRLFQSGSQRIWASDVDQPAIEPDTSSVLPVVSGPFAKLLILAPGEEVAPGSASGRTGTPTDQSINYLFTVQVLGTDSWWNPVGGASDVVHLACTDPGATLPPDTPLSDGRADLNLRLATGGFQEITVSDVTDPSKTESSTQVRAISTGFHLEVAVAPEQARAGEVFTLTVRVVNDAGSVIQEINSFVTIEVQNATSREPGRGALLTTRFQLLQGQRAISETYTFAEPIILIARDDEGNAPGVSNAILIDPGVSSAIQLSSDPPWVRGEKHATVTGRLVDAYDNGVPGQPMSFELLSGSGILSPVDSLTNESGVATADYRSGRIPEVSRIRAHSDGLTAEFDLMTAVVDPNAAGGTVTNYPNPFHPEVGPTTIAYKLDRDATVILSIYTLGGALVREEQFPAGSVGGFAGLNEFAWNGENGSGKAVGSGGYVVQIEAKGGGETLHVMRRKIAIVR